VVLAVILAKASDVRGLDFLNLVVAIDNLSLVSWLTTLFK